MLITATPLYVSAEIYTTSNLIIQKKILKANLRFTLHDQTYNSQDQKLRFKFAIDLYNTREILRIKN